MLSLRLTPQYRPKARKRKKAKAHQLNDNIALVNHDRCFPIPHNQTPKTGMMITRIEIPPIAVVFMKVREPSFDLTFGSYMLFSISQKYSFLTELVQMGILKINRYKANRFERLRAIHAFDYLRALI